jgi:hypothetical protein
MTAERESRSMTNGLPRRESTAESPCFNREEGPSLESTVLAKFTQLPAENYGNGRNELPAQRMRAQRWVT